jgi:hypothetical protein
MTANKPPADTRPAQADRVATFLETNPASTLKEIDAVCDTGCISKVLSAMEKELHYVIAKDWREVRSAAGTWIRRVRTYKLLCRPSRQPELFTTE